MKLPQRPKRFIVIPRPSSPASAPSSLQTMRLMHLGSRPAPKAAAAKKASPAKASRAARKAAPMVAAAAPVKVVNRSPADGALLLEPQDHVTLERLKAQAISFIENNLRSSSDEELGKYSGVLGHYHIQSNKVDPGPAFQWDKLIGQARKFMEKGDPFPERGVLARRLSKPDPH